MKFTAIIFLLLTQTACCLSEFQDFGPSIGVG